MTFKSDVLGRFLPRRLLARLKHGYTFVANMRVSKTQYVPTARNSSCLVIPKVSIAHNVTAEDGLPLPPPHLLEGYKAENDFVPQGRIHMGAFVELAQADGL